MNTARSRYIAALLALALVFLSTFCVNAEGGDGSGGGDNHDKPLTLATTNVPNGADNVDPNVKIELHFTKNVVNIAVREDNMKCFSVTDSQGNNVPITPVMGDDQVITPDTPGADAIKRTVTIVPDAPYKCGETYILKIKKGLAAKNGRDILDEDILICFTIADETTTARRYVSDFHAAETTGMTTTTTTRPAETTAKAPRTTKPVIAAATGTTAAKAETTTSPVHTAATSVAAALPVTSATVSQTSTRTQTQTATSSTTMTTAAETITETIPQTQTFTTGEATGETIMHDETDAPDITTSPEEMKPVDGKQKSPAVLIGIIIALAAAAAAVIGIYFTRKRKDDQT